MRRQPAEPQPGTERTLAGRFAFAARLCWGAARGPVVVLVCAAPVQGLVPVGYAWLTRMLIDGLASGARHAAIVAGLGLVAVTAVMLGLAPLSRFAGQELGRRLATHTQAELYGALSRLPSMRDIEDPAFLDRVRLAQQVAVSGPQQVITGMLAVVQSGVTLAGFIAALAGLDGWVAVLVVASAFPELIAELRLGARRADMLVSISSAQRRVMAFGFLLTDPAAAPEIQAFGVGRLLNLRVRGYLSLVSARTRARDLAEARTRAVLSLLGALAAASGLALTVLGAFHHQLTIGDVAVVLAALSALQLGLSGVVVMLAQMAQQLALLDHYRFVLQAAVPLPAAGRRLPMPALTSGLELRDVWFRHGDNHPWVLRGVSLTMRAGGSLALVGTNGAGKSTIVKLLCRLYEPTKGTILWDGVDIADLPVDDLRRRIATVFQSFVTYDLTAAENIGVGDLDRLHERPAIQRAAAHAGIHDAVTALQHGYDTLLSRVFFDGADGQAGTMLSTGQSQRLAVARALFRDDVSLVILDEPAAGLDPDAEHELHCRLRALRRDHTTLLISHRLSAVRDAETIAVLDHGQIIETGTHHELLAANGRYAGLFRLQAAGYADVQDGSLGLNAELR